MSNLEKKERRVLGLRNVNSGLVKEIESMGGEVDLMTARIENLVEFLVQQGILTKEQKWDEQESWELRLRPQLITYRDRLKEMVALAAERQRQAAEQAKKAAKPTSPTNGLILPPGAKKD